MRTFIAIELPDQIKNQIEQVQAPLKKTKAFVSWVKPGNILFVGDWPERDIKGAKAIGMKTAFAKYGSQKTVRRHGADYELERIEDLLRIV